MTVRILVVDDEPRYLRLLEANLLTEGYEVITAMDGEEAVESFSANPVDLVLLDVMLPRMDGFAACQRIRQFSSVPIIMLTRPGSTSRRRPISVPMSPLRRHEGRVRALGVRDAVRLVRVLRPRLSGPPGQLHRGQSAVDAAAHRAGVVLPALLRHPARHPQQAAGRGRHVLVDPDPGVHALARYLARALGQVPPGLQVVLLAVHHLGDRARLSRLQAAGGRLRVLGARLHGLLFPALPGHHADRRRDREPLAAAALDHRVGAGQGRHSRCGWGRRRRRNGASAGRIAT